MADDNLWSSLSTMKATDMVGSLGSQTRTPSNTLDKDAFLKLLIAQMKYQDPMNPMDDKEFLGQMAQFTSLEQMQNLNSTFSKSQAYAMIGKTVYSYYQDETTGAYNEVKGLVSAVTSKNGEMYLYVEGTDVPLSSVTVVGDDYFTASQLNAIYEGVANARDMSFVGKYIQALLINDKEEVTGYVEGIVDYVKFNNGQAVLVVDDQEVFPGEVASVSEKPLLKGKTINARVQNADGEYETITGAEIRGVTIKDSKAYLDIDGYSVPIDKINYIMEALQYVDQQIDYDTYSGKVDSITVKNGIPYFDIGDKQLSYVLFKDL